MLSKRKNTLNVKTQINLKDGRKCNLQYLFSVSVITNDHKWSGFSHSNVLSYGSVRNSTRVSLGWNQGFSMAAFLSESFRVESVTMPFLETTHIPGLMASSSIFFFLATACSLWHLSSLTTDWTPGPSSGSQSPNHWTTKEFFLSLSSKQIKQV